MVYRPRKKAKPNRLRQNSLRNRIYKYLDKYLDVTKDVSEYNDIVDLLQELKDRYCTEVHYVGNRTKE